MNRNLVDRLLGRKNSEMSAKVDAAVRAVAIAQDAQYRATQTVIDTLKELLEANDALHDTRLRGGLQ